MDKPKSFNKVFKETVKNDKVKYGFQNLWAVVFWVPNNFSLIKIERLEEEYFIYELVVTDPQSKDPIGVMRTFGRYSEISFFAEIPEYIAKDIGMSESKIVLPKGPVHLHNLNNPKK